MSPKHAATNTYPTAEKCIVSTRACSGKGGVGGSGSAGGGAMPSCLCISRKICSVLAYILSLSSSVWWQVSMQEPSVAANKYIERHLKSKQNVNLITDPTGATPCSTCTCTSSTSGSTAWRTRRRRPCFFRNAQCLRHAVNDDAVSCDDAWEDVATARYATSMSSCARVPLTNVTSAYP